MSPSIAYPNIVSLRTGLVLAPTGTGAPKTLVQHARATKGNQRPLCAQGK